MRSIDDRAIKAHADLPVSLRVRLRAVRVPPEREGHRVSRTRRRDDRRARARRRLRRRRHAAVARRGSRGGGRASIRSIASGTPGVGSAASAACATCTSPTPTAWRCRFPTARSTSCSRTPSSSTWPTRRCTCASARACSRRDGPMYLSTAPYLSFAGAHLPRLKVPVPLHLLVGRRVGVRDVSDRSPDTRRGRCASRPTRTRSSRRPGAAMSRKTTCSRRFASRACGADCRGRPAIVREELHVTATVRRLPAPLAALAARQPAHAGRAHQQHGVRARGATPDAMAEIDRYRPEDRRAGRCALPARVRPRRGRGQPAALGLAVPAQPEQSRPDGPQIWIAREGTDHRRPVRDDAGAAVASPAARCTARGAWT